MCGPQASKARRGDRADVLQVGADRLGAGRGDPVRPAAVLRRQRLDQALRLEPADRAVERAGAEGGAGDLLDVLDQRVAVLRPVGETGEDEHATLQRRLLPTTLSPAA